MIRYVSIFLGILILSALSPAYAKDADSLVATIDDPVLLPANSTGDIDFAADVAGFLGRENQTFVEFYFLFRPSEFTLEEQGNKIYKGVFSIGVSILDEQGNVVHQVIEERTYETDRPVVINRRGEERVMVDRMAISIPPGTYQADILVTDMNSKRIGKLTKPFIADRYDENKLMISELQFATYIKEAENQNRFTKNGLLVMANPLRIFEKWAEIPEDEVYKPRTMYIYFEMYNLVLDPSGASSTYDVSSSVTSHTSGMTFSLPQKKGLRKPGSNGLKVLAFDYMTFPEDIYTIKLVLKDNLTGAEIARTSIFEVVQPPPPPPPVTVLTEDQAKRGNRMLKFLASKRDMSLYDKLGLEGKTEFLINFWKERDPTPDTPENEFMIVFNERFSFADFQLGGAESDRGNVFIKYGQPEEIERNDSNTHLKSFQIWYYTSGVQGDGARADNGGRQFFVFGDRRGIGRYELLHSSARGEISNPRWRSLLLLRQDQLDPTATQFDPSIQAGKLGESGANQP